MQPALQRTAPGASLFSRSKVRLNPGSKISEPREQYGSLLTQGLLRGVALLVLLHFVAVLLMASQPQWHLATHADADDAHHHCAVTLITGGGLDIAPAIVIPVASQAFDHAPAPVGRELRLEPAHLLRSVLEHAPPRFLPV